MADRDDPLAPHRFEVSRDADGRDSFCELGCDGPCEHRRDGAVLDAWADPWPVYLMRPEETVNH